ncbi:MAG: hypothetical protein WBG50_09580 [Desulfomonilaceae bacterium]
MQVLFDPLPSLPLFSLDSELVIRMGEDRPPEIYVEEGLPRPDRHLLLGIAQSVLLALEELDPECVVLMNKCTIKIQRANEEKEFASGLIVVRVKDGRFGAVVVGDSRLAVRLARQCVRWFTGTIRLDVP